MKDSIFGNMKYLKALSEMSKKQRQIIAKQLAISKMAQYADLAATISTPQMDAIASAYNNCTYLFESPQIYNP